MCVNLKYNIKRLLLQLPGDNRRNKYLLLVQLGIHYRTLDKWMDTPQGDRFGIPHDKFDIIAEFLKVNPSQLINQPSTSTTTI